MELGDRVRKAVTLIAKGIMEKDRLLAVDGSRYPFSEALRHGMNMFLAAAATDGRLGDMAFEDSDEASFYRRYLTQSVDTWFERWDPQAVASLPPDAPYRGCGPLVYDLGGGRYMASGDCDEFLESQGCRCVEGTDEYIFYDELRKLPQDGYVAVRSFAIEHPFATASDIRGFLRSCGGDSRISRLIGIAYEDVPSDGIVCPTCGWIVDETGYRFHCGSVHGLVPVASAASAKRVDAMTDYPRRLKADILRYVSWPGKVDMDVYETCRKFGLAPVLWPYKDRYDVEVALPNGDLWEVDAKAYRNPRQLAYAVSVDSAFRSGNFAKGFYVVPDWCMRGQANYRAIVRKGLSGIGNVDCLTVSAFRRLLKKEVGRNAP